MPNESMRAIALTPLRVPSPLFHHRQPAERRLVDGDVVLLAAGTTTDSYWVFVLGPVPPATVFAQARAFFRDDPYNVALEAETAVELEAALREQGWQLDEAEPALVLAPLPANHPPPPAELTIRRVTTEAALADFFRISATARHWVPTLAAAVDPGVALLVGYRNGQPVATARVARCDTVGDISGVVTAAEHRRRGYGTALTWAAIAAAEQMGCTAITLTATEMGYPVYVRMGFVPVCTFKTFTPPVVARL